MIDVLILTARRALVALVITIARGVEYRRPAADGAVLPRR